MLKMSIKNYQHYNGNEERIAKILTIIFPIYKQGDINTPENCRGISLMDSWAKLFQGLV